MSDVRVEPPTAGGTLAAHELEQLAAWWGDFAAKCKERGDERGAFVGGCNATHFARKLDAQAGGV